MNSKKAIIILITVLVAAVAGIAFAQYVGAQANGSNNSATQTTLGTTSNVYPHQGYNPYGSAQNGDQYDYGRGMGMCGRFW